MIYKHPGPYTETEIVEFSNITEIDNHFSRVSLPNGKSVVINKKGSLDVFYYPKVPYELTIEEANEQLSLIKKYTQPGSSLYQKFASHINRMQKELLSALEFAEQAKMSPGRQQSGLDKEYPPSEGIVLAKNWDRKWPGRNNAIKDLSSLLSQFAAPKVNLLPPTQNIEIYSGVDYLMSYEQAREILGLDNQLPAQHKVICPGFPQDSFFYAGFDGVFKGQGESESFNRLYLVLDVSKQVVCVQLVNESPQSYDSYYRGGQDWKIYNFIQYKRKGSSKVNVNHRIQRDQAKYLLYRIDSVAAQHDPHRGLEKVQLYLPLPVAELILQCVVTTIESW